MHQLDQAPRLAEAGADLIVGHHPHVLQGIDWIDGTPVVYSIGNFLFSSKTLDSCLVRATLDAENGTLQELQFVPAIQKGSRSVFPDEMERSRIIAYVQNLSPNVLIDPEGCIQPKDSVKTVK
jgi:poly-gamma-glutamate synthesis protein (capsule biosynthesis protein)